MQDNEKTIEAALANDAKQAQETVKTDEDSAKADSLAVTEETADEQLEQASSEKAETAVSDSTEIVSSELTEKSSNDETDKTTVTDKTENAENATAKKPSDGKKTAARLHGKFSLSTILLVVGMFVLPPLQVGIAFAYGDGFALSPWLITVETVLSVLFIAIAVLVLRKRTPTKLSAVLPLIACFMALATFCVGVFYCIDYSRYDGYDDGYYYSYYGEGVVLERAVNASGDYTLPLEIAGKTVVQVGDYAFSGCNLTSLTVPNKVNRIGAYAFSDCTELTAITFEENSHLFSIGESAFAGAKKITSLSVPDSVTNMGYRCFGGMSALRTLSIPFVGDREHTVNERYSYPIGFLFGSDNYEGGYMVSQTYIANSLDPVGKNKYYIPSALTTVSVARGAINQGSFESCSSLVTINLPSGVTAFGARSFIGCSALSGFSIPSTVTQIGAYAFYACSSLTEVTLAEGMTELSEGAFDSCSDLVSVTLPSTLKSIGENAFSGCGLIEDIAFPSGLETIGKGAFFRCTSISEVELPASLTEIGTSAFAYCTFDTITLPSDVKTLGSYAFFNCQALSSVTLNAGLKKIENNAFEGCKLLAAIELPQSLTYLGGYAFKNCTSLTALEVPAGIRSLGGYIVSGCASLNSLVLPFVSGTLSDGDTVVPLGFELGECAYEGGTALEQYNSSMSGGENEAVTYYAPSGLTKVTVTGGNVKYGAFYGCSSLTEIVLPSGLTEIGAHAFDGCSGLIGLEIPYSVSAIGEHAFSGCSDFDWVRISGAYVAQHADSASAFGGLLAAADTLYINSSLTEVNAYILANYDLDSALVEFGGATYKKYTAK